jgi:hypothetical protein
MFRLIALLKSQSLQAALQREGVDFTLHEVITLARRWSHDGSAIPCKQVLDTVLPSSHDDTSVRGTERGLDHRRACSQHGRLCTTPCAHHFLV